MGKVTDYIRDLVTKQVAENSLVVWFDPVEDYKQIAESLEIPGATVICYQGSFLELRHDAAPLMVDEKPPKLLVYVPLPEEKTDHALVAFTKAGTVLKPGQHPWQRNTRLSVIARQVLKEHLDQARLDEVEKKADAKPRLLTLADLDLIADQYTRTINYHILSLIFGFSNPQEITLSFLSGNVFDQTLIDRRALDDLKSMFDAEYGITLTTDEPDVCRGELARHLFVTAFFSELKGGVPERLTEVPRAETPSTRKACTDLVQTWQKRQDLQDQYVQFADKIENALGLSAISFTIDQIADVSAFRTIDQKIQRQVEEALLNEATPKIVSIARQRQDGFWSGQDMHLKARWILISTIGDFLLQAKMLEDDLRAHTYTASEIIQHYTGGSTPWCRFDTLHRHLEDQYFALDPSFTRSPDLLPQLMNRVRQIYTHVGGALAETFIKELKKAHYTPPGVSRQLDLFADEVTPVLERGKTAYFLVDALRFEMGRELTEILGKEFTVSVSPALATVPTITEVGMAALMLHSETIPDLVPVAPGKVGLEVDGILLKDRGSRIQFLKQHLDIPVTDLKLADLLAIPRRSVEEQIKNSDLIIVTSREIDQLGEEGEIYQARRYMGDILHNIRRAMMTLANHGVKTIIISADHGYLFGEEIESDMKIGSPGGSTVDLHRRIWIGRGGAPREACIRITAKEVGLGGDLELVTPYQFGVFKVPGGGTAYFHGGLSPQEVIVPVLIVTPKQPHSDVQQELLWKIYPGSKSITTRTFSIKIEGRAKMIAYIEPPKVRVEIRSGGKCISRPLFAHYGFEEATGDVQLRLDPANSTAIESNVIILQILEKPSTDKATIHLLNANTGVELRKVEDIPISILI